MPRANDGERQAGLVAEQKPQNEPSQSLAMMPTLNAFDAATGRTVVVKHGDLFGLRVKVDLLVISAWENVYEPEPGSMVAVLLERCGLVVGELPRALDLCQAPTIRSWVSEPLDTLEVPPSWPEGSKTRFRRLAVIESPRVDSGQREAMAFQQMFRLLALLPLHGIHCTSVATPLLNTGRQNQLPEDLFPGVLDAVDSSFRHVPDLRQLVIVDLKEAALRRLCDQINERLHRTPLQKKVLSLDEDYKPLLQKLLARLKDFQRREQEAMADKEVTDNLSILMDEIESNQVTPVTLGISARKLLEALVQKRLAGKGADQSLFQQVRMLGNGISAWSVNAIHTVRTFGNWMGHATPEVEVEPIPRKEVEHEDMIVMLLALQRVLDDYPWPGRIPASPRKRNRKPQRKVKPIEG